MKPIVISDDVRQLHAFIVGMIEQSEMIVKKLHVHPSALAAATAAIDMELTAESTEQRGYLHKFPDGKLSIELEWIDTRRLAEAAIDAYLKTAGEPS